MRKKLLASAAMAIAIGCTGAIAQEGSQGTGGGMSHSPGSAQHQPSPGGSSGAGGATRHNQATPGGSAAQNQAIPDKQGMGPPKGTSQNQERGSSTRQRGAEENGGTMQRGQGNNMRRGAEQNNKTNKQRGAEQNNRTNMQRGAEQNNGTNMQRGAEQNNRTTKQRGAEQNDRTNMQRGAEENNRTNMQRGVEGNNGTTMQRGAEQNERGGAARENRENNARIQERGGSAGGKSVQLSESQRTQIKSLIVKDHNVVRDNSSNFSIAVGTAVPHNVHVAPLPSDVIRVVPQYRGFDYVVVRDQLLIIDPDTMKIVAVLPA